MLNAEEARDYFSQDRFATENGMSIDELDGEHAVTSLTISSRHKNAFGDVMGGAIFTLADFAFAALTNDRERVVVAQQVSINYLSPAKGSRLVAAEALVPRAPGKCILQPRECLTVIDSCEGIEVECSHFYTDKILNLRSTRVLRNGFFTVQNH